MQPPVPAAPAVQKLRLLPGEVAVVTERTRIHTLLGSCVSVTLWHPRSKVGAMSHALLPSQRGNKSTEPDGRYGDEALAMMLARLVELGVNPRECQAKIFGGGSMLSKLGPRYGTGIGLQNGQMAERLLAEQRIRVVNTCLYGDVRRSIIFDTGTGEVWSRLLDEADGAAG